MYSSALQQHKVTEIDVLAGLVASLRIATLPPHCFLDSALTAVHVAMSRVSIQISTASDGRRLRASSEGQHASGKMPPVRVYAKRKCSAAGSK